MPHDHLDIQVVPHMRLFRLQLFMLKLLLNVPFIRRKVAGQYHVEMRMEMRRGLMHAWPVLKAGPAAPGEATFNIGVCPGGAP